MNDFSAAAEGNFATTARTFPLTAAQRDIWLDQLSKGDSPLYTIGGYVDVSGPINPAWMQAAFEQLVAAHDALRTSLVTGDDGLPLQQFAATMDVLMPVCDFTANADPQGAAQALVQQQLERTFGLGEGPLFRFCLIRLAPTRHWLSIQVHHLILDGWGFGLLLKSLSEIYSAVAQGQLVAPLAPSYVDFIQDDANYQGSARQTRDQAYWLDKYRTQPEPLLVAHHQQRAAHSQTCVRPFPLRLHERLKTLAQRLEASAFPVLLAALHVYFSRTAQRDDWVLGVPIINRGGARYKSTLGLFTQVSPVRLALGRECSFAELVLGVRDVLKQDFRHQRYPLSALNRTLGLMRADRAQLFEVTLSYEQDEHAYRYGDALAHTVKVSNLHEATPLAIHVLNNSGDGQTSLYIAYNQAYFAADEVDALSQRLLHVLEQGVHNPNLSVGEFSLGTPAETRQLQQWNATGVAYPKGQTLHQRIEQQAALCPDALAAVCAGRSLSYAQLNQQANGLARELMALGVKPDDRVALVARRGLDTLVGLLAILKSGAAYVPIDPAHPPERLNYLLRDCQPVALLVQRELRTRLPVLDVPSIDLDQASSHADNPRLPGLSANHLAYVIYTSGSTGLPKGVMVEHHALGNLVDWHCNTFDLGPGRHTSSLAGFGFDAMAWEVWPALCSGATLHLPPPRDGAEDLDALLAWWRAQPLQVSFLPTPVAEYLFSQQLDHPTLRTLLIGGDRLRQFTRNQRFAVINNYGPTEATVVATSGQVAAGQALHIGTPICNTTVYLLDAQQQPLPIGTPGELYVGGVGVARGYLNRPQLTAERFLHDPFSEVPGARMYRTGDLARWRADGTLDYLGRNDDQVKIRGVRVELGEIEAALASHVAVKDAVALVRDGQLLAWFSEREPLDIVQLHAYLQTRLPAAMLPAAYVRLAAWPLTANGKLDRQALPAPGPDALIRRPFEAPQGEVETQLALLWCELLSVERVGRQDHFFELGGHSLLAVALVERMRQQGMSTDVQVLFGQPTLASLAQAVGSGCEIMVPANLIAHDCQYITPALLPLVTLDQPTLDRVVAGIPGGAANVQDIYPLAALQEGLLYHHLTEARDPYQQYALFAFDQRTQLDAFARALQQVIERHDILRTSLVWEGLEQPLQVVWRKATLPVETLQLDGDVQAALCAHADPAQRPLDMRKAPMMALACAEDAANGRWLGLLRFHHLINDATSTSLLLAEIEAQWLGRVLPTPVPYRNRVVHAASQAKQHDHEAFFRTQLADLDEPTLAFELPARQADDALLEEARQYLAPALAERLRQQARQWRVSPASLFHLAWAQVLGALSARQDVVFGTVLLGRLQAGAGADRALGMFINTLPLRLRLSGQSVSTALAQTQAQLAALLAHEQAPLALAQRCSAVPAGTPLFNSLFNYRHALALDDPALLRGLPGMQLLGASEIVSYPLMLVVDDLGAGFRLGAKAPQQVGARRLLEHLHTAIEGLTDALEQAPHLPLHDVPVLSPAQRERLLVDFNATAVQGPQVNTLQALFEAQVRRTPDAVAVQAGQQQLSYRQLNAQANQLAHHLRAQGVQPDSRVAICVERGLELMIGLLGILKAGGAYVPLDPGYPAERLRYMVEDSAPVAVLVHAATRPLWADSSVAQIDLDQRHWQSAATDNPQVPGLGAASLAYVIYTSGSTGTPKGVMIEHRGLCNLMHWGSQICPASAAGALLQKAPFSFDGSVWELFWPLTAGLRLVMARPDGHRDPAYLAQVIREQRITVVKFVPALLQQFLLLEEVSQCTSLTDVFCGGGELTAALARGVRECLPQVRLHNVYGPTETTVDSTAWTLEADAPVPATQLPIGRPIANTRLYVLDALDRPVPLGVSGQLHIGGIGVARGYLGLEQLMAERFIDSPFVPGDRLYRTGDLVRYREDGNLEFLGRNDFQVKLHGLRLELGEIEARLLEHPAVREVLVLMREERLVAYFTRNEASPAADIATLRAHVLAQLPDYMAPSAFVCLALLPLSPNGKVDRKALPAPGQGDVLTRGYEAPQGEVETALAEIWAQVLKLERVGRHDHFFELGGHSLLAVSLVARMREAGLHADARTLFSQPTLAALAANTARQAQQVPVPATTIPSLRHTRRL